MPTPIYKVRLRGIPVPDYRLSAQERAYKRALAAMSEGLRQEARNNNLFKGNNETS